MKSEYGKKLFGTSALPKTGVHAYDAQQGVWKNYDHDKIESDEKPHLVCYYGDPKPESEATTTSKSTTKKTTMTTKKPATKATQKTTKRPSPTEPRAEKPTTKKNAPVVKPASLVVHIIAFATAV